MSNTLLTALRHESELWFPNHTAGLVREFETGTDRSRTLIDQYGTARWLANTSDQPRPDGGQVHLGARTAVIEYLPSGTAALFGDLRFADRHHEHVRDLQAAADVLTTIPSLAGSIGMVVKAIHPLSAPTGYDISHSTPDLPFTVFVSVPRPEQKDAPLRLAESLIHEAMHLQLTLIDAREALTVDDQAQGYSPWKAEQRPITGLLHGLYVFAVIHQALAVLKQVCDEWRRYCDRRRDDILAEIALLRDPPSGLSTAGDQLWRRCLTVTDD